MSTGAIVGLICGGIVILVILIRVNAFCIKNRNRMNNSTIDRNFSCDAEPLSQRFSINNKGDFDWLGEPQDL